MPTTAASPLKAPDRRPQDDAAKPSASRQSTDSHKIAQGSISFIAFIAVFVFYAIWLGGKFTSAQARMLDIHQNAPVLLLGLAVLVTLIAGKFDLSVASMATLSTFLVVGLRVNQGLPFALVIVIAIAVGLVGGLINGLLVVRLKMNTFIATLGTGGVFLGISAVYSKGTEITPISGKNELPHWFAGATSFGSISDTMPAVVIWIAVAVAFIGMFLAMRRVRLGDLSQRFTDAVVAAFLAVIAAILIAVLNLSSWVHGVSWTIGFLILVTVVMWVLLGYTTFGRHLRATGSNAVAARLARVNTGRETIKAFVLGGLLAALAGIVLAANQGAAAPNVASGYLLPAFAAAFLSTVVLSNGRFEVWGTIIGGIFLVWVGQGLIEGGLAFTWTEIIDGLVLILAVAVSSAFRRSAT